MISFKISDLPMGKSSHRMSVDSDDLQLEEIPFKEGILVIDIERMVASIKVDFYITGNAQLVCDRSLDVFDYPIDSSYSVLFRADQQEDVEDEYLTIKKLDFNKNKIDLTSEIRETILLEIPIKKLHPRYFDEDGNPIPYQVDVGGSETNAETDARWDVLKHIKNPHKN